MAQPLPTQTVQLFKAETLGVGSYGAVCKARCDELPCAAKILHPVMFQFNDPGAMAFLRKFEQECQFLRTIKHPNIVQYVATSRDRETGLPVLLMELMDESLTSFLERSQQPLPYHTQVNLCHDIALALAYLHSNGIMHRDLSSNNVLLNAGSGAKVTDFGMSKLIDTNPRMTPLTKCPGMLVYMSPEALRDPPVYSNKLDCFSEGVLTIQIITRKFPNPGQASRMVEDPRSPVGRIQIPVPEAERRRSHIDFIDSAHSLLPLALRCLEYNEEDRPSAQEICCCLATIKEAPIYTQSMQIQTLQRQLEEKDRQLQAKDAIIAQKERENRLQLREKDRVIEGRERQLRELNKQLQTNEQVTAEFQQNLLRKEREVRDLEERLSEKERLVQQLQQLRISDDSRTKQEASGGARKITELKWKSSEIHHDVSYRQPAVDGKTAYFRSGRNVWAYDSETEKWSEQPQCPLEYFALAVVNGLLTAVGGNLQQPQQLLEKLAHHALRTAVGGNTRTGTFGILGMMGDLLTGRGSRTTNKLLSLTGEGKERKWVEHFPPMPTERYAATALYIGRHLIVAGGAIGHPNTDKVEVMNTATLQWTTASSLPHPVSLASATLCGDDVYMLGGYDQDNKSSKLVFRCSLNDLLQSNDSHKVWQRVTDLPVTLSACATLQRRLLAIGGVDSSEKETTAVHEYNPVANSWKVVSHMPTPIYGCAVAVLPRNTLMAVDGDTVQIGILQ